MTTRVRFAPSPTGHLHVGGARTALFNWLFARSQGGAYILRIEDTDAERSDPRMVQAVLDGLKWLGLEPDEGPYFQSERLDLYRDYAARLVAQDFAYRDIASESEQGVPLRFRVPKSERIGFVDQVFGRVEVSGDQIEDFVILRSDGRPTYHLSVVVDDLEMGISHVIRGVDHLSNTPKQMLLYRAFGAEPPAFAHLPLILGPDRSRLSKRHGATAVSEFRDKGFLPEAMRNHIALLGWSPGDDLELMTESELIERFSLDRVNRADAVFDFDKLVWMNAQFMARLSPAQLLPQLRSFLMQARLWDGEDEIRRSELLGLIELLKSRCKKLTDFCHLATPFLEDDFEYEVEAVEKYLQFEDSAGRDRVSQALLQLKQAYDSLESFGLEETEAALRSIAQQTGLKAGQMIGAVRTGLIGRTTAPGIFDVIVILGKERVVERLDRLVRYLQ